MENMASEILIALNEQEKKHTSSLLATLGESVKDGELKARAYMNLAEILCDSDVLDIVETIVDYYKDDKDLITSILMYLKSASNNKYICKYSDEWLEGNGYCTKCGNKMQTYSYVEKHTELDYNNEEVFYALLCPYCEEREINESRMKEED